MSLDLQEGPLVLENLLVPVDLADPEANNRHLLINNCSCGNGYIILARMNKWMMDVMVHTLSPGGPGGPSFPELP